MTDRYAIVRKIAVDIPIEIDLSLRPFFTRLFARRKRTSSNPRRILQLRLSRKARRIVSSRILLNRILVGEQKENTRSNRVRASSQLFNGMGRRDYYTAQPRINETRNGEIDVGGTFD